MHAPSLTSYKLLCFDCYGTIVDWEGGIYSALKPLLSRSSKSRDWDKSAALTAYESVEKDLQTRHPDMLYYELLSRIYRALAERLEVEWTQEEADAFGASIKDWPAFSDSIDALQRLSKHYKMVILSNVDIKSFDNTRSILSPWVPDLVLTAQEIGSYKPAQANFTTMLARVKDKFGVEKSEVLITAQSLFHDHRPTKALGMNGAWIDRAGACMGVGAEVVASVVTQWTFKTLGEMADAVEKEAAEKS